MTQVARLVGGSLAVVGMLALSLPASAQDSKSAALAKQLTAALDAHYAKRWTVRLDLAILLRTVWINLVGKRRGARPLPPGLAWPSP